MAWPLIANLISMAYDSVHQGSNDDTSKAFNAVLSRLSKSKGKSKGKPNDIHQQLHNYERNLQTPKLF